jgi:Fur family zinc uptake transcriptional regulator
MRALSPEHVQHNHKHCVREGMAAAESYCTAQGLRLTDIRKHVLELIWADHRPVGAYAILERLTQEGHAPAPPTVYRALEFLTENGLVHRIESRNAFVACAHPGESGHVPAFFLCSSCDNAIEIEDASLNRALKRDAAQLQFQPSHHTLEIQGLCAHCQI